MRLCLIICAALVSACGVSNPPPVVAVTPAVSDDLTQPCSGWGGGVPQTEGQWAQAAAKEQAGRVCANAKLATIREIIDAAGKSGS